MLFKASAPGSLMLLGEHAVLHGKLALVCAVDKRMSVTIVPRSDRKITISSALGKHATDLSNLKIVNPFEFVLATLKKVQKHLPSGCDITIESEFSDKVGFASSAAVTVATLAALNAWLNLNFSLLDMIKIARTIIRKVQGLGSGADVAACVMGGVLAYRALPLAIEKLTPIFPLTVVYSGSKTPTVQVIEIVKNIFNNKPKLLKQIYAAIENCSLQAKEAINTQNWAELGQIMNINQGLMDSLGVGSTVLNDIVYTLRRHTAILGSKISGSGLGDCVIGLGALDQKSLPGSLHVAITDQGVTCEQT